MQAGWLWDKKRLVEKSRVFPHPILWICRRLSTTVCKNAAYWLLAGASWLHVVAGQQTSMAFLLAVLHGQPEDNVISYGKACIAWIAEDGFAVIAGIVVNVFFCRQP